MMLPPPETLVADYVAAVSELLQSCFGAGAATDGVRALTTLPMSYFVIGNKQVNE
jgi:hypothetical protein